MAVQSEKMNFDYSLQPGKKLNTYKFDKNVKPLVSVITAFYNAGAYFQQTFHSVMNQTFPWFEWIIVNDGSTKKADLALLYQLAESDTRVRVINQKNAGLSSARNTAVQDSRTEIIVPLDADDLIEPQYLEYLYWGLFYNPDAAWCYTCSVGFQQEEYLWKYPWDAKKLKTYNFLNYSAAVRKQDLLEIGGYKTEKQSYFEDWRFWLEMLQKSKKPVHLGGYLFWYRRLDQGMLASIRRNPKQKAFADRIIQEAAKTADGTVRAKEYPLPETEQPYYEPKLLDLGEGYRVTDSRIHILMLIPWMELGGSDQFNLYFVQHLDKKRFQVSVMTTVPAENSWQQKFARYTDQVFHLPDFLDPAYYLDFVGYFVKAKAVNVVFVTNSYKGYYMLPWLRKHFPDISIIDYVHMEEWYWKAGGYARISAKMGGFLDKTYVCSSAARQVMVQTFGRSDDSVKVMHIGADTSRFDPQKVKSGYLYHRYRIPKYKKIILFPCRMHPQKRPFLMLEIAKAVCGKRKDVVFVAVGDGDELAELKHTLRRRKLQEKVLFIGRSEHMRECYQDAELTLICSLKEGLALTAYESLAMGVPVVSSDVGGQKDLIDDTVGRLIKIRQKEESGFHDKKYDQQEIEDFADAILQFLADDVLYEECRKNCRKKVESSFSVTEMAERMEKEILDIVSDDTAAARHREISQMMCRQGKFAEEFYTTYLLAEEQEQAHGRYWPFKCCLRVVIQKMDRLFFRVCGRHECFMQFAVRVKKALAGIWHCSTHDVK